MTPPRRPAIAQTRCGPLAVTPPTPITRPGRSRQPKTRLLSHPGDQSLYRSAFLPRGTRAVGGICSGVVFSHVVSGGSRQSPPAPVSSAWLRSRRNATRRPRPFWAVGVTPLHRVRGLELLTGVSVGLRSYRVVSAGSVEVSVEVDRWRRADLQRRCRRSGNTSRTSLVLGPQ